MMGELVAPRVSPSNVYLNYYHKIHRHLSHMYSRLKFGKGSQCTPSTRQFHLSFLAAEDAKSLLAPHDESRLPPGSQITLHSTPVGRVVHLHLPPTSRTCACTPDALGPEVRRPKC